MSATSKQVIAVIVAAPEHFNPAIKLLYHLRRTKQTMKQMIAMVPKVQGAIAAGEAERGDVKNALSYLMKAEAIPAALPPTGF
jgi:hypothetical protein